MQETVSRTATFYLSSLSCIAGSIFLLHDLNEVVNVKMKKRKRNVVSIKAKIAVLKKLDKVQSTKHVSFDQTVAEITTGDWERNGVKIVKFV